MSQLGKIAYDTYSVARPPDDPLPPWETLAPDLQAAWAAAAEAAAAAVLPDPDSLVTFEELGDLGVVQEVNRRLLHPVGLALARHPEGLLTVIEDGDPEGWRFEGFDLTAGEAAFEARQREWHPRRRAALGYVVQPTSPQREAELRAEADARAEARP